MHVRRWLAASLIVAAGTTDLFTQVAGAQYIYSTSGIGFTYNSRRLKIGGFFGTGYSLGASSPYGVVFGPVVPVVAVVPAVPVGIVQNHITIQSIPPTIVVAPRVAEEYDLTGVDLDLGPPPWVVERNGLAKAPPMKAVPPAVAAVKKVPPPEPEPEPIVKPTVTFNLGSDLPPPKADPTEECQRLTSLGLAAFRGGDFGWAVKWLTQAIDVDPSQPRGYFLLAQANYALGKYQAAVEAIENGLKRQMDWPASPFQLKKELYQGQEDEWILQRKWLEEARSRRPNDPSLMFLQAYQLWFDGQRPEAAKLFREARNLAADPFFIDQFLRALPQ